MILTYIYFQRARDSNLEMIDFKIPMFAARDFGREVFGIDDFSFSTEKLQLRTSLVREKVIQSYSYFEQLASTYHIFYKIQNKYANAIVSGIRNCSPL